MVNYRIWYLDNTVVDGYNQTDWDSAPEQDVLAIATFIKTDSYGRKIGNYYAYSDWYCMHNGEIYQNGVSSATEHDFWVENTAPDGAVSKRAVWTTNEHMEDIMNQVWGWVK